MNHPTTPTQPQTGDNSVTLFRISLCILPGGILAAGVSLAWKIGDLWPLAILPIPVLVMMIGYFEGQLALQQQQIDPSTQRRRLIRWSIFFLIMQMVIAPMFSLVFFFGYAVISNLWMP